MTKQADRAVVVVGELNSRSMTMDKALRNEIKKGSLRAEQVLHLRDSPPRLDANVLPLLNLSDHRLFIDSILQRRIRTSTSMCHATETNTSKLLTTATRDATIRGPRLREAHRHMGLYLAQSLVADQVGLESCEIPHTQGGKTNGYRLLHEEKTLIVALMRGGEPMALGVSDAFQLASFLHADRPADIRADHLRGMRTLLLVDSVVNSGKTIREFVKHVRELDSNIRIVVVAGVGQKQAVSEGGDLQRSLSQAKVDLVFLRLSDNKYTGKGGTDTGNRLFNTTHLD